MSDVSSTTTGLTGAGGGSKLRITGMATGLDVDSMVTKMMAAEQTKVDKVQQDRQTITWRQEAYQDIIKDLKELQSSFFDSTTSDKNILSSASFSPFEVAVTIGTGASATASSGAQTGTYTIDYTGGHLASTAAKTGDSIIKDTSDTFTAANWAAGNKIGFSINGGSDEVITLGASGATATDVMNEINTQINNNSKLSGKVQAIVSATGTIQFRALSESSVKISNSAANTTVSDLSGIAGKVINPSLSITMSDLGLTASDSLSISYNGTDKEITINPSDKLSDVINNIGIQTAGKVKASFSQLTGSFKIETSSTGAAQSLKINSDFAALGLASDGTTYHNGEDAVVKITPPGAGAVPITITRPSNNFTIDAVNFSLSKVETTTISVNTNTQKVYDKIKGFIDKYNAIVDKIQTKITEKKNNNYKPLTDTQKSQMKDADITTWQNKAKEGILRNDNNLQNLLQNLKEAFSTTVADAGLSVGKYGSNSIGLNFSESYEKPAHIDIIDDSKLKSAISQNSSQLLKMFTNASSTALTGGYDPTKATYKEDGIFTRIKKLVENNVGLTNVVSSKNILTKYASFQDNFSYYGSGGSNTLPDQLYQKDKLIKTMTDALKSKQERYYQQFSKLETAMNQLNTQQSWMTQQLGG